MSWRQVDEGWGRKAVDFATLTEPSGCREYLDVHQRLGIDIGDRLLDVACGAGLAIELASIRGAECAGIDASRRLVAIAQDRTPEADIRVGDMLDLPWEDESFDIVTTFRGIWATTPGAFDEAHRVLRPGGRIAMTVWGNVSKSPGAWVFAPLTLATDEKMSNQAEMVSLGRPGVGEQVLRDHGFEPGERFEIGFVFEFPDPEGYARGLAAVGPAHEAMQNVGEPAFLEAAREGAEQRVRDGLPLRGLIQGFGYIGEKR